MIWSGGTPLAPLPVGDFSRLPIEPILRLAAATATVHPESLRCFTVPFWRSARPDLTPVLAWSPAPSEDAGSFISPEAVVTRWRLSVLAALEGMAGGPAAVLPFAQLEDAAQPASVRAVEMLTFDASVDELVAALELLEGSHETFPSVVEPGAVATLAQELAAERVEVPIVGSMQLYWSTEDTEFNEIDSFSVELMLKPHPQLVRMVIPNRAVTGLRLDPTNQPCLLAISAIRVVIDDQVIHSFPGGQALLDECHTGGLEAVPGDPRILVSATTDPLIELDLSLGADRGLERFIEVELAAVPLEPGRVETEDHAERLSGEDLLAALEAAMPARQVHSGVAEAEWAVDLAEWVPEGFVEIDGWSVPELNDPAMSSPVLDAPPTRELIVRCAVRSDEPVSATLYFAASGAAFTQSNALHFQPIGDGEWHDYSVDIPDFIGALPRERAQLIRFDPVDRAVPFRVESLRFVERGGAHEAVDGDCAGLDHRSRG